MKIYLAGGMKDGWQDRIIPHLVGHKILDPRTHHLSDPAQYTKWDLDGVAASDVVIGFMNSNNPSGFGLSLEIGYAYALGKKIIFWDELGVDWRSPYFGMHRVVASVVCPNLSAVLNNL